MKRKINTGLVLLFSLGIISCEKLLDLEPKGNSIYIQQEGDTIFKSANDAEAALGAVYGEFQNEYWQLDYFVNGDAQSDDAYAGADNPANFQIDEYRIDATNSNVNRDWGYLYRTIGRANVLINNVEKINDPALTAQRKLEIKGEASFVRAIMYFQAVQLWGDVPLQLKEVTTVSAGNLDSIYPQLYPERKPKEEVYALIVADLEFAAANVKTVQPHKGYATKGAAHAYLAKVYATIEPKDYGKVIQYCDAVINGGYTLLPDYDMLWNNEHENSPEAIFEVNYEGTSSNANWGASMFSGTEWKKFNIPTNDLVKAFDDENDAIRKNSSIVFSNVSGLWSDANWPVTHYPFINKYRIITYPSPQNYILMRLADIILLKAEALNETGDVNGAAQLVNQIRARVELPPTTASNQEQMRHAIEKERRLELAFEGHRWYDLKRTGRAIEVINSMKGPDGNVFGYNLTVNGLLWPIPQAELDKNALLTQNPGY
ncbi:MAG: RagB/SusD family nutrient uptake outer membrane protein [Lentimicrobiaceae bacterium]|nr:RagB/SusD family nutrient uptake outer membrane protein [Lentimicrobiaceae bacterium]